MIEIDDKKLEEGISQLIEEVENAPEGWYKLLIERLVKQELTIEILMKKMDMFQKFENINSAVIDNGLLQSNTNLKESFEIKATDALLPDEGFHTEETGANGKNYRWTKQNFYMDIPLQRDTDKTFKLYMLAAFKPELLENIRCFDNGNEVILKKTDIKPGTVLEGTLKSQKTSGVTRLAFQTVAAYVPKDLDAQINDTRELAVTFSKLIVE